jgi:hypothetical protein
MRAHLLATGLLAAAVCSTPAAAQTDYQALTLLCQGTALAARKSLMISG